MTDSKTRPEREIGNIPPDAEAAKPKAKPADEPARERSKGAAGAGASDGGRLGRIADRKDQ